MNIIISTAAEGIYAVCTKPRTKKAMSKQPSQTTAPDLMDQFAGPSLLPSDICENNDQLEQISKAMKVLTWIERKTFQAMHNPNPIGGLILLSLMARHSYDARTMFNIYQTACTKVRTHIDNPDQSVKNIVPLIGSLAPSR